ncbi:DJ-1 family glyoxalase III [Neptuniibacter sp. CAU 1671]|uniref:DJ-1 family glyoxalase III n=1 Tax=Neptuniibacter sp. CAU 1671 TaxID=3032593 RepID=UPI0023DC42A1|nr:DJ-1 family glyoxalase III [Neptuniibacter sp. CAU 1671]MDF2180670.1 DJ-1/PfpI family protein [Neptuniibacter sp. CAU 1671]
MPTALIVIADGVEEIEAVTQIDLLRRAGIKVTVAAPISKTVCCSRGVILVADTHLDEITDQCFDLISLPGGMPGAEHLRDSHNLIQMLKKQQQANRWIGAICASPAVALLPHGLLNGYQATCYPSFQPLLAQAPHCHLIDQPVVCDKNLITSQGPGTALEFSLTLVEVLCGKQQRDSVAAALLV